jgi:hypothetical protein
MTATRNKPLVVAVALLTMLAVTAPVVGGAAAPGAATADAALALQSGEPSETFNRTYGTGGDETARQVRRLDGGGYLLAGTTVGADTDAQLVRTDDRGREQWTRSYGEVGADVAWSVVPAVDGDGYVVAGATQSAVSDTREGWLIRVDGEGAMQWERTYGGTGSEAMLDVEPTDNGYIMAGFTNSTSPDDANATDSDAWIIEVDSEGTVRWSRRFGGDSTARAYDIERAANGGYVFTGTSGSFTEGNDRQAIVQRIDASGDFVWRAVAGGSGAEEGLALVGDGEGRYAMAGATTSYGAGGEDTWLQVIDGTDPDDVRQALNATYGGEANERALAIERTDDGGYLLGGTTTFGAGATDSFLVGAGPEGEVRWNHIGGGNGSEVVWGVDRTEDGHVYAGETSSYGAGGADAWLVGFGVETPDPGPTPTGTAGQTTDTVTTTPGTASPATDTAAGGTPGDATSPPDSPSSPGDTATTRTTTGGDSAGFGLLLGALALLGAGLAALRRR